MEPTPPAWHHRSVALFKAKFRHSDGGPADRAARFDACIKRGDRKISSSRFKVVLELLTFAPCEKVIFANDGTVSVIAMLDEMKIGIPDGAAPPPEGTSIPHTWATFTMWVRDDASIEQVFRQKVSVVSPDGIELLGIETDVRFPQGIKTLRLAQPIFGFPVWREGECRIAFALRDDAAPSPRWNVVREYPVTVSYESESQPHVKVASSSG
jgi:hypothetical protein